MFGRTKKEITIHNKFQEDLWVIEADSKQLEQVLLNLYINAWQAMPAGGVLYLETKNNVLDENECKSLNIKPGRYVHLSVTDTGIGMNEATKHRIFDPFFTTKEMGRGIGLGLASAYGIITNHNGIITVDSKKEKGTTFNIYLPASEKEVTEEQILPEDLVGGKEKILFVDDEKMVIDVGKSMLEKLGYQVLCANSGREAIELFKKKINDIDLVILDLIMPDVGGEQVFNQIKELDPKVKVLLSSGYSINGEASKILKNGCDGFIQKPFNLNSLSQKVRSLFGESRA
jgi:CheY-like chemotaxis protein